MKALVALASLTALSLLAPSSFATARLVKDIVPGSDSAWTGRHDSIGVYDLDGTLLFPASAVAQADAQLWKTDGTAAGTSLVSPVRPDFFVGRNGSFVYFASHFALWKTDGTAAGTSLVKDTNVPVASHDISGPLVSIGNTFLYGANDSTGNRALWTTDGTTAGTTMVQYLNVVATSWNSAVVGSRAIFFAKTPAAGIEPWVYDDALGQASLLKDIRPGTYPSGSEYQDTIAFGNRAFFIADDGFGNALWKSDGTSAGTVRLASSSSAGVAATSTALFYVTGGALWKTDGTAAGSSLVRAFDGVHYPLVSAGNRVFFKAEVGGSGADLWVSDGTAAGTAMVKKVGPPGIAFTNPFDLYRLGDHLQFKVIDAAHPIFGVTFVTDGTAAGTVSYAPYYATGEDPHALYASGKRTYFVADDGVHGSELWLDDGVPAPTTDGGAPSDDGVLSDGGSSGGDTGTPAKPTADASPPPEDVDPNRLVDPSVSHLAGCSCDLVGGTSPLPAAAGAVSALGLLVLRRRKRSRQPTRARLRLERGPKA